MSATAAQLALIKARKAIGGCIRCGEPAAPRRFQCERHLAMEREWNYKRKTTPTAEALTPRLGPVHFIPRVEFARNFPQARCDTYRSLKGERHATRCPQYDVCAELLREPAEENVWLVRDESTCGRPRNYTENTGLRPLRRQLMRELPELLAWIEAQRAQRAADHSEGHAGATGTWIDWTGRGDPDEADRRRKEWNHNVPGPWDEVPT